MANSLKSKLSGLRYRGIISNEEYHRLCKALDVLDKIRAEIEDMDTLVTKFEVLDIIEKYEAEKEEI